LGTVRGPGRQVWLRRLATPDSAALASVCRRLESRAGCS
jgi:hypothetical protein